MCVDIMLMPGMGHLHETRLDKETKENKNNVACLIITITHK